MSSVVPKNNREQTRSLSAIYRALAHALDEYKRVREEKETAEIRLTRFADTIQSLLEILPEDDRREYTRRFNEIRSGLEHRGGEVFGNVIQLFRRDPSRSWSVPELQSILEASGKPVDAKSISNVIGYLAQIGRLTRVARGHYRLTDFGMGLIDGMEIKEDGTDRATEHNV